MLEPELRQLLLDGLRPPAGYAFERAIGTTYSLDLLSLIVAPLGFALFDRPGSNGRLVADPIALLQAVRRYAEQIDIFCQAGEIAVPAEHQALFAYLEESVHAVAPPNSQAIFHPKIWLMRYRRRADDSLLYRLLCLSRNLTFDRSWDTVLLLEGEVPSGGASDPSLAEFVRRLPGLCSGHGMSPQRAGAVRQFADELTSVIFQPPEGFDRVAFWPIGHRPEVWPFTGRIDRLLVVSPFLTQGCLARLSRTGTPGILISRADSLDLVGRRAMQGFAETLVMSPAALPMDASDGDSASPSQTATNEALAEQAGGELRGLHAKLYVADAGRRARIWTGSANATDIAFGGNVEFLVELEGPKASCGVDATIGYGNDDVGFRKLLEPYAPPNDPRPLTLAEELDRRLDALRRAAAQLTFVASVTPHPDDTFELALRISAAGDVQHAWWQDTTGSALVRCRPLSLGRAYFRPVTIVDDEVRVDFGRVSFEGLTSFFVLELTLQEATASATAEFVVNARLIGAPVDRRDRILVSLLRNGADFIRFLLLFLGQPGVEDPSEFIDPQTWVKVPQSGAWLRAQNQALLEPMVRTLAVEPSRLDEIAQLLTELESTGEGRQLVPEGWQDMWRPIWEARESLRVH